MIREVISDFSIKSPSIRGAILSSGVMAFAGLGDAVLYPVLPIYADNFGISTLWVGLLLSINRFVRVLANTWVANQIRVFGMKKVLMIAAWLSVITTVGYGLKLGLISLLVCRIIWGISYSGLKTATYNYAAQNGRRSGLIFGLSQSIKSLGALVAFLAGPVLINYVGLSEGLLTIAMISILGIGFTLKLPSVPFISEKIVIQKTFSPTPVNLLVFGLSVAIDGILIVVLAHLFKPFSDGVSDLLITVAYFLLLSRLMMVGVSFLSGIISLKVSPLSVFRIAVVFCVLGLFLISFGHVLIGVILVFLFNAVVVSLSPLIAVLLHKGNDLQAVSSVSTWWDLGAGLGALFGLVVIDSIGQRSLFLVVSSVIALLFFNFIFNYAKANKYLISTVISVYQKKNTESTGR